VLQALQNAEKQLRRETEKLNREIRDREEETRRANALFTLFEEKRFLEDVKNGRVSQPPIFYEAWNGVIGRLEQFVKGADEHALPLTYESFNNTLLARTARHNRDLLKALQ
jgi:hypothetical protein